VPLPRPTGSVNLRSKAAAPWVVVTGGAGYVGSRAVLELLASGHRVRVLDSLLHGSVPSLLGAWGSRDFEFVEGDVRDPATRGDVLAEAKAVIHLAAIVGDPACARQPEAAREVNLEATRLLLADAAHAGIERFIFLSTCSNYGKLGTPTGFATEEWSLSPLSVYAETKVEAEREVLSSDRTGLTSCCLRLATVYGSSPRMRFDLTVNEFVRDVLLMNELEVYGEQFWRPYIHVRDAARALRLVLEAPAEQVDGEVFNVGSTAENYRKIDIVELLKQRVPRARVTFVERDEDPRDYRVSFDKISERLGFNAEHTVSQGIDEIISLVRSRVIEDPFAAVYRN
jgi:nucleoside-diphosphate-sugar epimerase